MPTSTAGDEVDIWAATSSGCSTGMVAQVISARTLESMNASSVGEPSEWPGTRVYREERSRRLRRNELRKRAAPQGVPNGKPFPACRTNPGKILGLIAPDQSEGSPVRSGQSLPHEVSSRGRGRIGGHFAREQRAM